MEVAREVTRRSIGTTVTFHAVSCELYPEICRSYGIDGFPIVLGYTVGSSMEERGWTLNQEGVTMTAETIAEILELALDTNPKRSRRAT